MSTLSSAPWTNAPVVKPPDNNNNQEKIKRLGDLISGANYQTPMNGGPLPPPPTPASFASIPVSVPVSPVAPPPPTHQVQSHSFLKTQPYISLEDAYNTVPFYTPPPAAEVYTNSCDKRLDKLIALMEKNMQNQSRASSHVPEELLLFALLGVAVIYTLDSFTHLGKYIR